MFASQEFEFDDFDTQIQPEELIDDRYENDEPFVEDCWDEDTTGYEDDNAWPYEDEPEPQGHEFYDDYNDGENW